MKTLSVIDLLRQRLVRVEVPDDLEFALNEKILCEKGKKEKICARVLAPAREIPGGVASEDYEFQRKLEIAEVKKYENLQENEKERIKTAQGLANKQELEMKFFASRKSFDNRTTSLFFTSEKTIDFRSLLKELGTEFKTRIHLERVGTRDKAKICGGYGTCGKETCCSNFKTQVNAVPMDAARDQNLLTKDNEKILGCCGKLKCCLMYELPQYREMRKKLPHLRQSVFLENGEKARVIALDILNERVKVIKENDTVETVSIKEISIEPRKEKK
jgi:cell fate regulator YaaT (PSP1 superfamily)